MGEEDNKRYDRCNQGCHANPETADTKSSIFDGKFYLLRLLPRRLVIRRQGPCRLRALYWFNFLIWET